jgi:hypothetical protein
MQFVRHWQHRENALFSLMGLTTALLALEIYHKEGISFILSWYRRKRKEYYIAT